ncbi:MAG: hypothetical protein KBS52_07615 [Clostridiales bacterium]|nr:hypothetical protein [Candidatus Equinaster intestinalis]
MTDKKLKEIEQKAQKLSMNRSEYIRYLIRNCQLVRTPNIDYEKWHSDFKALGDEFNQYVKAFYQTGIFYEKKAEAVCNKMIDLERQLSAELTEQVLKEIEKSKGGTI